jgi:DNA-binding response OmpR family regulator
MNRIVLVDDNLTTIKRWESLLLPFGHEVISFTGAEPALQFLKIHHASLLILDLAMPIHSGYDLMQTLRSESISIPVLVVSGKNNQNDITKALSMGAVDYVLKPFDDDIFVAKVEHILKTQTLTDEEGKNPFAEAIFSQASQFSMTIPNIVVSEMGFKFQTNLCINKGTYLEWSAPCFADMGIKDTRFRATTCFENPLGQEFRYTVFVSFVGLSLAQLKEVRIWVRQNQLKMRKAV